MCVATILIAADSTACDGQATNLDSIWLR